MGRVVCSAAFPRAVAAVSRSRSKRAVTVNIIRRILVQSKRFLKHQQKAPEKAGRLRMTNKSMDSALGALPGGGARHCKRLQMGSLSVAPSPLSSPRLTSLTRPYKLADVLQSLLRTCHTIGAEEGSATMSRLSAYSIRSCLPDSERMPPHFIVTRGG